MKLTQVIGRARSGKSAYCLSQLHEKLIRQARGPALIYLVPEQMTFQMELALINLEGIEGVSRAQVYSFTRLAWRVLSQVGGMNRAHIDSTGVKMLIRKIIEEHEGKLKVYGQIARRSGFIAELEALLVEYKRHQVSVAKLEELLDQEESNLSLLSRNKLEDILLIYRSFEEELAGKYLLSEDYLELLIEKIPLSSYIREAVIYIDGFYTYSQQEEALIRALIQHARQVVVTHVLDQPYPNELPHILNFFRPAAMAYQNIRTVAVDLGAEIEEIILKPHNKNNVNESKIESENDSVIDSEKVRDGDDSCYAKASHPSLSHLEANYNRYPIRSYQGETNVDLMAAVNRRVEVEGMARQIVSLVRDSGYAYRDIAIIVRNIGDYQPLLETILPDLEIPYFLDQKESMLHHPLIEFVRSSLDAIIHNWPYEALFRLAKTGLIIRGAVGREWVDQLENFALSRGIRGESTWTSEEDWLVIRDRDLEGKAIQTSRDIKEQASINQARRKLAQPLTSLEKQVKKAKTGRDYALTLYTYLEELEVTRELDRWQSQAEDQGRLVEAKHHEQAWQAVMDILDQFVEIMGEREVDLDTFAHIIDSGLEGLHFSLVPAALEQVIVADLDHSRLSGVKAAFILGVNEGVIPAKQGQDGLLTDGEREELAELGLKMAPGYQIRMLEDNFAFYRALASPTDYLWVSHALADLEGKEILPSMMIKHLTQILPQARQGLLQAEASDLEGLDQLDYVTNPQMTISYLMSQLRHWQRSYPIPDFWWEVYNYYINLGHSIDESKVNAPTDSKQIDDSENSNYFDSIDRDENLSIKEKIWHRFNQSLTSLFYENKAEMLEDDLSLALYGQDINLSVSRLESYQACPFAYFAGSGLGLSERELYGLGAPDIGNFYHAILSMVAKDLIKEEKSWADKEIDELYKIARKQIDQVKARVSNNIFKSSGQMKYRLESLERVLQETIRVLREQETSGSFRQQGAELSFGYEGTDDTSLPGLSYELAEGRSMKLRGKIDRMDMSEDREFLCLIDYKSSRQALDADLIYHGLSLQLMTYLDVLLEKFKNKPAAALYFHVHNARLSDRIRPSIIKQTIIAAERKKSYKLEGLLINNRGRLAQMDKNLEGTENASSEILPVSYKKDGNPTAYSRVASEQEFELLIEHTREKSIAIGREIIQGRVDISPYRTKSRNACNYCPYSAICQFEPGHAGNSYRWLTAAGSLKDLIKNLGGGSNGDKVD